MFLVKVRTPLENEWKNKA